MSSDHHRPCSGGCGELSDECACPPARRNPLGSMTVTEPAPNPYHRAAYPRIDPPLIPCCQHCGCLPGDRHGHDDTCRFGCNDDEPACTCSTHSGLQPDCPQHGAFR